MVAVSFDFSYLQSLNPGMDNSLSSYMNQRSKTGEFWKQRWFVLNIATQTLVCYDNHLVRNFMLIIYVLSQYIATYTSNIIQHDEAIGAIPLAGYTLSLPTEVGQVQN